MFRLGRCFARTGRFALAAMLAVSVVGCQGKARKAESDTLPPNKLATMMRGDQLINEGEDLKEEGMKLRADGKDGDELIKQGDAKIAEGEELKSKGMMMKD